MVIVGSKITLSLLTDDGNLIFNTVTYAGNTIYGVFSGTVFGNSTIVVTDDYVEIRIWYTEKNASEGHLAAAKLELGPTQTLAHREGDKWVLNEVPDYGEQLRRCQRYFWRLHSVASNNYAIFAYGMKESTDQVRFVINFPATFRVSPVITAKGKFLVSNGIEDYAVDSIEKQSFNGESIVLVAKSSTISALPNGTVMRFGAFNDSGAYVDFSADL